MQNYESLKTMFVKNLSKQIFSSTVNIPIDNNVKIKNILDVDCCLIDLNTDCGNGKAVISGKIGVKVLYLDLDNMTNILTDSQGFTETVIDPSITSECMFMCGDNTVNFDILSIDNPLKISCEIGLNPVLYLNLPLNFNLMTDDNMIVKKDELSTTTIAQNLAGSFEYMTSFETKDEITKVLCSNNYFSCQSATAQNNLIVIEGKLYSTLLYETQENDEIVIKELNDCFNIKHDFMCDGVDESMVLDLCYFIDHSSQVLNTSHEDDNSVVEITNKICLNGVANKHVNVEYICDLYSTANNTEITKSDRAFFEKGCSYDLHPTLTCEITLSDNEPAIESAVSNLSITPEITNVYVKDGFIMVEGIISSQVMLLDENKSYYQKKNELPFVVDSKIACENLFCHHASISVTDCRMKTKRGTIVEISFATDISITTYDKKTVSMIDTVNIGAPLDFSQFDFQIFLSKPNETIWDLSKRIKISPDDLRECNPSLPDIMTGSEKVIVKR